MATDMLHIKLYPSHQLVVEKMKENGIPVQETIRNLIAAYGKENFPEPPAYVQAQMVRIQLAKNKVKNKQEIEEMSNEDYAKNILQGRVAGDKVWFVNAHQVYSLSLDKIKNMSPDDEWMKMHRELVNNLNPEIKEEWREQQIKKWQEAV